jgi:Tfp pilus assembly major pilin PilA
MAGMMSMIVVIGIVAAVSIPAYKDYVKRAQLAQQSAPMSSPLDNRE